MKSVLAWFRARWEQRTSRRLARLEICLLDLTQAVRTLSEVHAEKFANLDVRLHVVAEVVRTRGKRDGEKLDVFFAELQNHQNRFLRTDQTIDHLRAERITAVHPLFDAHHNVTKDMLKETIYNGRLIGELTEQVRRKLPAAKKKRRTSK